MYHFILVYVCSRFKFMNMNNKYEYKHVHTDTIHLVRGLCVCLYVCLHDNLKTIADICILSAR